eukprot:541868_1
MCTMNHSIPKIGICGAGIAGLSLGGILSKQSKLRNIPMHIDIFERSEIDRDQGYGLDLDEYGQEALVLSGVYDRYWDISRPRSDTSVLYAANSKSTIPAITLFMKSWTAARPESNRTALRQILLDEINKNDECNVYFETATKSIHHDENTNIIQLIGDNNHILGEYDLIIDAMGLHSTLRLFRVNDNTPKQYNGDILIHGGIENPEQKWSKQLLDRFDNHGTIGLVGKDLWCGFQRYGAGEYDNKTAFFWTVRCKNEWAVHEQSGIPKATSRKSGIIVDEENLNKLKNWILTQYIDGEKYLDPVWIEAIKSLERMTVRSQYMHGDNVELKDTKIPIVCIGDALRNCGLGGGGILAMQDTIELSKVLLDNMENGIIDIDAIRNIEPNMLQRKMEFHVTKDKFGYKLLRYDLENEDVFCLRKPQQDPYISVGECTERMLKHFNKGKEMKYGMFESVINRLKYGLFYSFCYSVGPITHYWYKFEKSIGGGGSKKGSRIYKNVKSAMKEMEKLQNEKNTSEC